VEEFQDELIEHYVQELSFDAFNVTILTDVARSVIYYHFVAKNDSVKLLPFFESVLRNAGDDFLEDNTVYTLDDLAPNHFCVSTWQYFTDFNEKEFCHLYPNAINIRFYEMLHERNKYGDIRRKRLAKKHRRVDQNTGTRQKNRNNPG